MSQSNEDIFLPHASPTRFTSPILTDESTASEDGPEASYGTADSLPTIHATPIHVRMRTASRPPDPAIRDDQMDAMLLKPLMEELTLSRSVPSPPSGEGISEEEQQSDLPMEGQAEASVPSGSALALAGSNTQVVSTPSNEEYDLAQFISLPAPSAEDVDQGISQGYRSPVYQFLETRTPTDTLPEELMGELPELEQHLLVMKKRWLSSPYAARLADILVHVMRDRREAPITTFVCLGVGTGYWCSQFMIFSQVVAQLSASDPGSLSNIYVQVSTSLSSSLTRIA